MTITNITNGLADMIMITNGLAAIARIYNGLTDMESQSSVIASIQSLNKFPKNMVHESTCSNNARLACWKLGSRPIIHFTLKYDISQGNCINTIQDQHRLKSYT